MSFFRLARFSFLILIFKKFFIGSPCLDCQTLETYPYHHLCPKCALKIKTNNTRKVCPQCHSLDFFSICSNCINKVFIWEKLHSFFSQKDPLIQQIFYQYKFQNSRSAELDFTRLIAPHLLTLLQKKNYMIVLVPCSPTTKKRLGFHPISKILCELKIPYLDLFYKKNSISMKKLLGVERKSLENPFRSKTAIPKLNNILIIDDILTTGTSMNFIAELLQHHTDTKIEALCFLRS